jgi:hypothetical protein
VLQLSNTATATASATPRARATARAVVVIPRSVYVHANVSVCVPLEGIYSVGIVVALCDVQGTHETRQVADESIGA